MDDALGAAQEPLEETQAERIGFPVIGVGASAGGLEAIRGMLAEASVDAGLAFVVVQHLDPNHDSLMAELIGRRTALQVRQIEDGDVLRPGTVHIIPPGHSLRLVEDRVLRLEPFAEPRGLRRPIDTFFRSLAEAAGGEAAGVVLSGTGADGSAGLRAIKEHGGIAVAQSSETARYDGMPMSAVGTGLVDFILPPEAIVERLKDFFDRRRNPDLPGSGAGGVPERIDDICAILRDGVGHDFSGYKRSTVTRRITRRMQIHGMDDARDYAGRLRADQGEREALFRDLLINVTSFFRDPALFEVLRTEAIVPLIEGAAEGETLRVWVPGCSSGEEAYTIAMLIDNERQRSGLHVEAQIFATDIDEDMLAIAREGRYDTGALSDIPEPYRGSYVTGMEGRCQVVPKLRDMIRFSSHSIVKDPPFSRLDLVSCRNMLIYMGPDIQRSFMPRMHYALRPDGFLFLGPSESVGQEQALFEPVNAKARLFRRRPGESVYPIELARTAEARMGIALPKGRRVQAREPGEKPAPSLGVAAQALLERYTPASVVLNERDEPISSQGRLGRYLDFKPGQSQLSIHALARPGLREALPPLLREARENDRRIAVRDVDVVSEFGTQPIDLVVEPLSDGTTLVVLVEIGNFRQGLEDAFVDPPDESQRRSMLEDELQEARQRLRTTVEELETTNEELKSSNEEMMSMNEELQSANEELSTVNEELKTKVDQIAVASNDMENFLRSTQLGVVVVDRDLRVREYTEPARAILPLKRLDIGRSLTEVRNLAEDRQLIADVHAVLRGEEVTERVIAMPDESAFYAVRVLPYETGPNEVAGATITFSDVTAMQRLQDDLEEHEERVRLALSVAGMGVWEYDFANDDVAVDERVAVLFGLDAAAEMSLDDVMARIHEDDRERVREDFATAIRKDEEFDGSFRVLDSEDRVRWITGIGRVVRSPGRPTRMIGLNFDVTVATEASETREMLLREMNHRVKNLFAVASGLVTLAARESDDKAEMVANLKGRIAALGRAHDATQGQAELQNVDLGTLIRLIMRPYSEGHAISIEGPDGRVPARAITPLSLILYEWATNSAKYGALSRDSGQLALSWTHDQPKSGAEDEERSETRVTLRWRERGGPPVDQEAIRSGFGTRLVQHSATQLDGLVDLRWKADGLEAELEFDA